MIIMTDPTPVRRHPDERHEMAERLLAGETVTVGPLTASAAPDGALTLTDDRGGSSTYRSAAEFVAAVDSARAEL